MPHLAGPRIGWEAERLAHYLLSRFSFVAQPTSIADDVGTDFFCTIFKLLNSSPPMVEPRGSFAIQIKSSASPIDSRNKIEYLFRLEIPFFIGVVTHSSAQMDVYSAERLSIIFAEFGRPKQIWLCPVPQDQYNPKKYRSGQDDDDGIRLFCPHIATFNATEDRATLQPKVDLLIDICSQAASNIATRRNEEHIYDMGEGRISIVAGSGSFEHFRTNFCKRLAEVFNNFEWILNNRPDAFSLDEFKVYEALYLNLQTLPVPPMFSKVTYFYERFKQRLDQFMAEQSAG